MPTKVPGLSVSLPGSEGFHESTHDAFENHILLQSADYPIAYGIFVANRIPKKYAVAQSSDYSLDSCCNAIAEALKSYSAGKIPKQYSNYILNIFSQFNYLSLLHYFSDCGNDSNSPRPELLPQLSRTLPKNAGYLTKFLELLRVIKRWYCEDNEGKSTWCRSISFYTPRELMLFEASALAQEFKQYIKINSMTPVTTSSALKSSLLSKALLNYPKLLRGDDDRRLRLAQYTLDKLTSERFSADPRQLHNYLSSLDNDLKAYIASNVLSAEERRARNDMVRAFADALEAYSKQEFTITTTGATAYGLDSKDSDLDLLIVNKSDVNKEDDIARRLAMLQCIDKWKPQSARVLVASAGQNSPLVKLTCVHARSKLTVGVDIGLGSRGQLANSRLVQSFASQCPFFLPLVRAVKHWGKSRQVVDAGAGFVSSWTLVLMVAQFLQLYGLLSSAHPSSPLCPAHDQFLKDIDTLVNPPAPAVKGAWAKPLAVASPVAVMPAAAKERMPLSAKRGHLPAFIYNTPEYKAAVDRLFASSVSAAAKSRRRSSITPGDIATGAAERVERALLDAEEWRTVLQSEKGKLYAADHVHIGLNDNESFATLPSRIKHDVHRFPANKAAPASTLSLSTLFAGFFTFYAHLFDRSLCGVSVRSGHLVWAEQLRQPRAQGGFNDDELRVFCVEEPFNPHSNTARNMTSPRITAFFLEIRRAALLLREQQTFEDVSASLVRTYRDLQLCLDHDASTLGISTYEYSRLLSCLLDKAEMARLHSKAHAAAATSVGGSTQAAASLTAEQKQQVREQMREQRRARLEAKLARKKAVREKREQKKALLQAAAQERQERYDALMSAKAMVADEREKQLEALRQEQEQDELFKITYDVDEEEEEEEDDFLDHFSFDTGLPEANYMSGITIHAAEDDEQDICDQLPEEEHPIIRLATLPSPKSRLNFRSKRESIAANMTSIRHILQDDVNVSDDEDDQAMHFSFA